MKAKPVIIPIASGKGGVGKTFLTANLAIALGEMGHNTIVIDMDLGGSNLHSYLGLSNRYPGLGDFLKARTAELEELLVSTEMSNLQFLPGDGRTPFMANISYAQKMRLISNIKKLPSEYILLDLGAGTSFNTLDFFRISSPGVLITTPEYQSIMNMLTFLKLFLLRAITRAFARNQPVQDLLRTLGKRSLTDEQASLNALQASITTINPEAGAKIAKMCSKYRPRIVFNLGEQPDDIKISEQIDISLENNLSLQADYFGFIFDDPAVRRSIKKRTPLLLYDWESVAARAIVRVAERIVKFWDRPVKNSARLLLNQTRKLYESQ
jgi:flagellar biosynthesis protein FlhG